jgi:antitoxin ParD1/3/4
MNGLEGNTISWYIPNMTKKNTSIALGERWMDYTRAQVAAGEFDSTSEVIRDALRLHEERAVFKSKLLEAIDAGLASPVDEEFDIDRWYDSEFPAQ